MSYVVHARARAAPQPLFEREDHGEPRRGARERPDTARSPRPDLRRRVPHDVDPRLTEPGSEPGVDLGEPNEERLLRLRRANAPEDSEERPSERRRAPSDAAEPHRRKAPDVGYEIGARA